MAQSADCAVFASRLQSQHSQSLGNDNALDFVVWWWDTLENLKSLHGCGTTGGLVRNHTTDGLVEDSGWGTEMERTCSKLVRISPSVGCDQSQLADDNILPPRVGLYLVIFRRYAWYLTIIEMKSAFHHCISISSMRDIESIESHSITLSSQGITYASHGRTLQRCSRPHIAQRRSSGR